MSGRKTKQPILNLKDISLRENYEDNTTSGLQSPVPGDTADGPPETAGEELPQVKTRFIPRGTKKDMTTVFKQFVSLENGKY